MILTLQSGWTPCVYVPVAVVGPDCTWLFLSGLTSLPAEVFHTGSAATAAWADIIREGAVDTRECVGYWPVLSVVLQSSGPRLGMCMCVCACASPCVRVVIWPFVFVCTVREWDGHSSKWGEGLLQPHIAFAAKTHSSALKTLAHLRTLQLKGRKASQLGVCDQSKWHISELRLRFEQEISPVSLLLCVGALWRPWLSESHGGLSDPGSAGLMHSVRASIRFLQCISIHGQLLVNL